MKKKACGENGSQREPEALAALLTASQHLEGQRSEAGAPMHSATPWCPNIGDEASSTQTLGDTL